MAECRERVADSVGAGAGMTGFGSWKIGGIGSVEVVGSYMGLDTS